jgi:diguanylate cyclase
MSIVIENIIRGPQAYTLGQMTLAAMEKHRIWPTPINYELWMYYVGAPDSPLALELKRLVESGQPITEEVSDELAGTFLPKARLTEQIRDAGDQLSRELESVSKAIRDAQRTNESYSETLDGAGRELSNSPELAAVQIVVNTLSAATDHARKENRALEQRLEDSTAEVARLKDHLEQVRRDATTDALTNLANRKSFDDEIERACEDADASGQPLALAVIDIDHFKNFNDTWGHQTGDQVIRYVASVIGRVAALPRFAARYGGEEFGVLFPSESAEEMERIMDEIREEISSRMLKRRSTNEDLGMVTVSAGVAQRRPGETPHSLIERADAALYVSKRTGRNRVTNAETTNIAAA